MKFDALAKFVFVHSYDDDPDDECNHFSPGVRSQKPKPKPRPRCLVGKALAPSPDAEACEDTERGCGVEAS
jgi:hypothetical protein